MSAQIPPGPWTAVGSADGSGQFGIVADGKFVIAEFFPDIRRPAEQAYEECRANALCAATAPELLAVVRDILDFMLLAELDDDEPHVVAAREVIAKATRNTV